MRLTNLFSRHRAGLLGGCAGMAATLLLVLPGTRAPAGPDADRAGSLAGFLGTHQGTYVCAQGETGVSLTIGRGALPTEIHATFEFYPVGSNPGVASGSFMMDGYSMPDGSLVLEPRKWLNRPVDWEMVGLALRPATRHGMVYGAVTSPDCDQIRLRKIE